MNMTNHPPFKPHILIANGVNLDLLGQRDPDLYGNFTLEGLSKYLEANKEFICELSGVSDCKLTMFQTNSESQFLETISQPWDGCILNPGAWTHTSLALGDRLEALNRPFIEVHISNLYKREKMRLRSMSAVHASGVIMGMGMDSYLSALLALLKQLALKKSD